MNEKTDKPAAFEDRTRAVLDASAERLDGRTRSRLTQARHAALAQLGKPARRWWAGWAPAGAATAAVVLAVIMWAGRVDEPATQLTSANGAGNAFEDIDLLADGEALDLVSGADEVEFYEWAAGEIES